MHARALSAPYTAITLNCLVNQYKFPCLMIVSILFFSIFNIESNILHFKHQHCDWQNMCLEFEHIM